MFIRHSRRVLNAAAAAAALLAASSGQAWSETLSDAIALAYQSNPALQAQRAEQRALDETYVQARSGLRPTFDVSGTVSYDDPNSFFSNHNFGVNTSVGMSQPLFTSGRAASAINAADSDVRQGREALRLVESQVIAGVIQAFEHRLPRGQHAERRREEEDVLRGSPEPLRLYVEALRRRLPTLRATLALRRLMALRRDYQEEPFLSAVKTATTYGLSDMERLERLILRTIGSEYFVIAFQEDPDDGEEED